MASQGRLAYEVIDLQCESEDASTDALRLTSLGLKTAKRFQRKAFHAAREQREKLWELLGDEYSPHDP